MDHWLGQLVPNSPVRPALLVPPPPIEDIEPIIGRKRASQTGDGPNQAIRQLLDQYGLRTAADRLVLWRHQCQVLAEIAEARDLALISLPGEVLSPSGMLSPACCGETDMTHGNTRYGSTVLRRTLSALGILPKTVARPSQPYLALPAHA